MKITGHHMDTMRTGRYYLAGEPGSGNCILWMVLHGYSQLAAGFIGQFGMLAEGGNLVLAPEALSRFYVKGYFGNVGASWMTREDRTRDIMDNIRYLDNLLDAVVAGMNQKPARIVVIGYSQGAATAVRWAAMTGHRVDDLVVWCSDFPRDISDTALVALSRKTMTWYVHASRDEFMDEALFREQTDYLDGKGYRYRKIPFDGKHEIRADVLARLRQAIPGAGT